MLPRFSVFSSIRSRLALLVAVCIVPASLIAVALLSYDYQHGRAELRDNAVITARTISSVVDQRFSGINATLSALATSPALAARKLKTFHAQALDVLPTQPIQNIMLMDPNGQELIDTLRPYGDSLPHIAESDILPPLAHGDGPVISRLSRGAVNHGLEISICVPVRSNGRHLYNLCALLIPEQLAQLLHQQQLPPDWIVAVLDSKANLVARSHDMERYLGNPASKDLQAAMAFDNEGWFEGDTSEGIAVLGAFSRSSLSNWSIAIGIPSRTIAAPLAEKLGWLGATILLLLSVSAAMAHVIGRSISKAVHGLVEPALALGHGKQIAVPRLHLREAEEVAAALRQASAMLSAAQYQAAHDPLTGLPNRAFFNDFIARQVAHSQRYKTDFSILYIDLDGFKPVNDIHGHAAGDKVLCEVGRRLRANIRESDVAARLGGDEFAVILVGVSGEAARKIADKLIRIISLPYQLEQLSTRISASIGIAGCEDAIRQGVNILQLADAAMYLAKAAGKGRAICSSGIEANP
jgi:diguanylate cyclase (GGDEF)-like protein